MWEKFQKSMVASTQSTHTNEAIVLWKITKILEGGLNLNMLKIVTPISKTPVFKKVFNSWPIHDMDELKDYALGIQKISKKTQRRGFALCIGI